MTEALFLPMLLSRDGLDPVAELADLRTNEPISKLELPFGITAWLVSGYAESKAVLGNADAFSNAFGNIGADESQDPGGLGMTDPPYHTRLRKMLTPEFTMRRLRRLEPRIAEIVDGLLDDMQAAHDAAVAAGEPPAVDIVPMFALPVPSLVICELLGVPYDDREVFQSLSTARFDMAGDTLGSIGTSLDYLQGLVERERRDPGEGLLGMLIREYGEEISDRELAGLADGILTGGHETTASTLSLGVLALLQNQQGYAALAADPDSETVHRTIEELLRYLSVVQVAFPRFAREDVTIGDVTIPAGEMVLCSYSAADRDPALARESAPAAAASAAGLERFDPTRPATSHLAFGYGIHRCVGAELARMELRIAFPALARRFPGLRLAGPAEELSYRNTSVVYGVETLPVTW